MNEAGGRERGKSGPRDHVYRHYLETFSLYRDTSSRLPHPVLPAQKAARARRALLLLLLLHLLHKQVKVVQVPVERKQVAQGIRYTERARLYP